jgi:hypothetical protein
MNSRWIIIAGLLVSGCEKDLVGDHPDAAMTDAPSGEAEHCADVTTTPLPAGAYKLYLNFEGVTLTSSCQGDARANCADFLKQNPSVIAPYMDGDSARQGRIDLILGYVTRALAPYSIDVVTTRPAGGDYMMVVLGGDAVALGFQQGQFDISQASCSPQRNGIALDFDAGQNAKAQANNILSNVGLMAAMSLSSKLDDCMNRTLDYPEYGDRICTFSDAAPAFDSNTCSRGTPQDELARLKLVFGCRE